MAKCGTGTLGFLDCHPNIVFRGTEPRYFNEETIVNQIIRAWRSNNKDRYGIFQVNLKNRLKVEFSTKMLLLKTYLQASRSSPQIYQQVTTSSSRWNTYRKESSVPVCDRLQQNDQTSLGDENFEPEVENNSGDLWSYQADVFTGEVRLVIP